MTPYLLAASVVINLALAGAWCWERNLRRRAQAGVCGLLREKLALQWRIGQLEVRARSHSKGGAA